MPALFDPRFDLFVRQIEVEPPAELPELTERLLPLFDRFGAELLHRLHQLRPRLAVTGDDDLAALFDLVDQAGKMRLGVENTHVFHWLTILTSLTRSEYS